MNTAVMHMRILVIDDDPISLRFIEKLLQQKGYQNIKTYSDAITARESVEKEPPDLILLDLIMPEMDGYQFSKSIRENESTRDIPILVVTGGGTEADEAIEKSFNAGATDYINKPINPTEFHARLRSALSIKKAHDRLKEALAHRKAAEKEREKLIGKLQQALAKVKKLSGLLPICASCKKIRDDRGYWNQIESYIREHSEADFTHSLCPECVEKMYPHLSGDPDKTP